jgi:hypothetical protein
MKCLVLALAFLCLSASGADKKKKPPDVQIVEIAVKRDGTQVTLDGRVRVTAEKPVIELSLAFEFRGPGKVVLTSKSTQLDEVSLEPGEETSFHAAAECPAKAVDYIVKAYSQDYRELNLANPGPYQIID